VVARVQPRVGVCAVRSTAPGVRCGVPPVVVLAGRTAQARWGSWCIRDPSGLPSLLPGPLKRPRVARIAVHVVVHVRARRTVVRMLLAAPPVVPGGRPRAWMVMVWSEICLRGSVARFTRCGPPHARRRPPISPSRSAKHRRTCRPAPVHGRSAAEADRVRAPVKSTLLVLVLRRDVVVSWRYWTALVAVVLVPGMKAAWSTRPESLSVVALLHVVPSPLHRRSRGAETVVVVVVVIVFTVRKRRFVVRRPFPASPARSPAPCASPRPLLLRLHSDAVRLLTTFALLQP